MLFGRIFYCSLDRYTPTPIHSLTMFLLSQITIMFVSFGCFLFVVVVHGQRVEEKFNNLCVSASSCAGCVQASPMCSWCSAENFPRDLSRCDSLDNLRRSCGESEIVNPKSKVVVTKDAPWTSGGPESPPVQVKPQNIEVTLRPNQEVGFKLYFQQQANYPVDLYFLLDLSYGMFREKAAQTRLIALGQSIPISMANITNNFHLGFGTFVDKLLMPYTAWTERMLQDRCPLGRMGGKCRQPHDFRNQLNLGNDHGEFADKMKKALESVSQSLDDAEGGLDGLIQALDCDRIGWRDVSRRIIVYSSNSLFHLAGDGLLGGATKQSGLQCDLSPEGEYKGEKIYDYPSVSQIASKLREKNANVIFAVMGKWITQYQELVSFLEGAVLGQLAENSDNIVELIKSKYYELRSRVEFKPINADSVDISMRSKCKGDTVKATFLCDNLEMMDAVEFDVSLKTNGEVCKGETTETVNIQVVLDVVGLSEQVVIDVNVQCGCACQESGQGADRSKCSGAGSLECGVCNCDDHRYGRRCECDAREMTTEKSLEQCRQNVNDSLTCSGNGECVCGECSCFPVFPNRPEKKYRGDFCSCNDHNCPQRGGLVCGGNGVCECSVCKCHEGWAGSVCECTTKTDSCVAANGLVCNGVGVCDCGRCKCDKTSGMAGPTCEDCPTCATQCSEYKDCAQCSAHSTGIYDGDECKQNCPHTKVEDILPQGKGIRTCKGIDVDGCTFFFTYQYTVDTLVRIVAQKTKECPDKINIGVIVGGTVAAVVVIPLLIILLVIFIRNRRDAKEYADFMRERDAAHNDATSNPLYQGPKTTFQNPAYEGEKDKT